MWRHEKEARDRGYAMVCGVDEAGRGPLAGPVVSAAVIFRDCPDSLADAGLTDSKKCTPRARERLYSHIRETALAVGLGLASPEQIDRENILRASLMSMAEAVRGLKSAGGNLVDDDLKNPPHDSLWPDFLLVDGRFTIPGLDLPQAAIIKGDARSLSIAAASIIAKVERDRLMAAAHEAYPQYGFDRHKGYPTKAHRAAIREYGPCPLHRRTFKGVREFFPSPLFGATGPERKTGKKAGEEKG
ncbi:MAG: ribonuclease HII [Desulfobacterales bacterium]|nr:MAG: ribonuclease HII [Desulfobacterales bacterium]